MERVSKRKLGYDVGQVDAFLERAHTLYDSGDDQLTQKDIQDISFDWAKGGYVVSQVDAALSRLEQAVVDRQTHWELTHQGRIAWKARTEELYQALQQHADRAPKARFASGEPKKASYERKQVDRLVDQVLAKIADQLGHEPKAKVNMKHLVDLNAKTVSNIIFTQRRGKHGYDERQVDYFLNSCVHVLARFESFTRLADYEEIAPEAEQDAGRQAQPIVDEQTSSDGVAPLFSFHNPQPAQSPLGDSAAVEREPESFAPTIAQPAAPPAAGLESTGDSAGQESRRSTDAQDSDSFNFLQETEEKLFSAQTPASASQMTEGAVPSSALANTASEAQTQTFAPVASPEPSLAPAGPGLAEDSPDRSADKSQQDSSLASLAHLAEMTEAQADDSPSEFGAQLPPLQTPIVPEIPDLPQRDSAATEGASGAATAASGPSDWPVFPADNLSSQAGHTDMGIPDLSFPNFNQGEESQAAADRGEDSQDDKGKDRL
ncbi:DivIVA domain-containing protein [Bifidobacterium aemilianum]|nr:DivIVA domain-containing protein [Bifidobacterium aemilianum]